MPALADQCWAAVKEFSHDVITFDLAQLVLRTGSVCPNGYGAMNGHAETNVYGATCVTWCQLGASDCSISDEVTSQAMLSATSIPDPPNPWGKSLSLSKPSRMGNLVSL